ncbi:MAG: cupredoxin domain-containing protein [bacterium]
MIRRTNLPSCALLRRAAVILVLLALEGCSRFSEQPQRIDITARKYKFEPAEIRVKQGTLVELHITSLDVQHGFDIPEMGIKEPIPKGGTAVVRFKADKRGQFRIACSIVCGPGHDDMRGRLIVE